MENKMIWFGRYLGCKYKWTQPGVIGPNQHQITEVNGATTRALERDLYSESKLILKELKDISDDDLKELNEKFNRVWNRELLASNNARQAKTA